MNNNLINAETQTMLNSADCLSVGMDTFSTDCSDYNDLDCINSPGKSLSPQKRRIDSDHHLFNRSQVMKCNTDWNTNDSCETLTTENTKSISDIENTKCIGDIDGQSFNNQWGDEFLKSNLPDSMKKVVRAAIEETCNDNDLKRDLMNSYLCFFTKPNDVMQFYGVVDESFCFKEEFNAGTKWTVLKFGGNGVFVHYISNSGI